MSKFSEQNAFSIRVMVRYIAYAAGIIALLWITGIWQWQPKKYGCYSGWLNRWQRVQVVDVASLQLYVWTLKRDCLDGAKDRYDPKQYRRL